MDIKEKIILAKNIVADLRPKVSGLGKLNALLRDIQLYIEKIESNKIFFPEQVKKANDILKNSILPHELDIYNGIEQITIKWSVDGTKTAGALTREIVQFLRNNEGKPINSKTL